MRVSETDCHWVQHSGYAFICFSAIKNREQRQAPSGPSAALDLSHLSGFERNRGCGSNSRWRSAKVQIEDGPKPRNPSAGGGRTHSPGLALPSLVWLPNSLGTLFYIIGKNLKNFCHILTKKQYRCGKKPLDKQMAFKSPRRPATVSGRQGPGRLMAIFH